MSELERIPEKKDRVVDFQTKYNTVTKSLAQILGKNIALYVCVLLPILLIGFIWTDFGAPELGLKYVSDGIITILLVVIGEIMMSTVGADGGKLDPEYITAKKMYADLVSKVNEAGTMFLSVFCEWQIDTELNQALTARLRVNRLTRADWDKIKEMPYKELKQKYGKKRAKKLIALHRLEPVELNEAILLFDNEDDSLSRGGVPISGDGYINKKTHSFSMFFTSAFACLLTVSVAITLTSDITFARVVSTAVKIIVLLFRMARGYQMGAKAYNTVEVHQLNAKSNYLRLYLRFIEEKTYLKLGDKYGDIECYITDTTTETPTETSETAT
jgi:hypothetical protein